MYVLRLQRRSPVAIVRTAALGVAQACIDDPDTLLVAMLRAAIEDAEVFLGRVPQERASEQPLLPGATSVPEAERVLA